MTVYYTGNIKNRKVYITKPGATSFLSEGKPFTWGGDEDGSNVDLARALIEHATGKPIDNMTVLGRYTTREVAKWPKHDPFTTTADRIVQLVEQYGAEP